MGAARKKKSISVYILPMTVDHIKIYKIRKYKSFKIPVHIFKSSFDALFVVFRTDMFRDTLLCKNIYYLSYRKHLEAVSAQYIKHRILRRHK